MYIHGSVYTHIFSYYQLRGPKSNDTLVAISTSRMQILVSNIFPNNKNQGFGDKWLILEKKQKMSLKYAQRQKERMCSRTPHWWSYAVETQEPTESINNGQIWTIKKKKKALGFNLKYKYPWVQTDINTFKFKNKN